MKRLQHDHIGTNKQTHTYRIVKYHTTRCIRIMDGKLQQLAPSIESPLHNSITFELYKSYKVPQASYHKISHDNDSIKIMDGELQQLAPSIGSPLQFNHG